jgi:hypothetical protein
MPLGEPPRDANGEEVLTEVDHKGLADWAAHQANGTVVHVAINSTRPHTSGVRVERLSRRARGLAGGQVPLLQRL